MSVFRREVPAPDGVRGRTPAWDCPACFSALSVVHRRGPNDYVCGPCGVRWGPDLFAIVTEPRPDVCPRCHGLTMGCDCCDPPLCRCECGWDVRERP